MDTLFTIIAFLIPLYLAYSLGKANGHREAVTHCDRSFISLLRTTKQVMDDWLVMSALTRSAPERFTLQVNNILHVEGDARQIAKWSVELGELIDRIEHLFPKHVHKQV